MYALLHYLHAHGKTSDFHDVQVYVALSSQVGVPMQAYMVSTPSFDVWGVCFPCLALLSAC
jgi:hypothetical protein